MNKIDLLKLKHTARDIVWIVNKLHHKIIVVKLSSLR